MKRPFSPLKLESRARLDPGIRILEATNDTRLALVPLQDLGFVCFPCLLQHPSFFFSFLPPWRCPVGAPLPAPGPWVQPRAVFTCRCTGFCLSCLPSVGAWNSSHSAPAGVSLGPALSPAVPPVLLLGALVAAPAYCPLCPPDCRRVQSSSCSSPQWASLCPTALSPAGVKPLKRGIKTFP